MKNRLVSMFLVFITLFTFMLSFSRTQSNAEEIHNSLNIKKSSNYVVSEVMTFEEISARLAKDKNISLREAKAIMKSNNVSKSLVSPSAYGDTYRTIATTVKVTSTYKPSIVFYCQTSESGRYWGINKILHISLDRRYNNITKEFNGSIYANLENAYTIYWSLEGDFYDKGTTQFSGGVDIGINEAATVKFGVSYASKYYAYCFKYDRFVLQR